MDNIRIDLDGRVTAWKSKTFTPKSFKSHASVTSEAWDIFCSFEPELQKFCLLSLGSSHVSNSHSEDETPPNKASRGAKGITAYGRSVVRNACQWFEDSFGVKNLSFLTCTLPPSALAAYTPEKWAECVRRFRKSLSYHLGRAQLCPSVVAVTEIQMRRYQAEQSQLPVHLHLVFQGRKTLKSWAYRPSFYQELWALACEGVLSCRSDWSASTRIESLRASSVSYMGKYMSKGNKGLSQAAVASLPTSWYSVDNGLRKICKASQVFVQGALAVAYWNWFRQSDVLLWQKDILITDPRDGELYYVAWMGAIKGRATYYMVANDIRSAIWGHDRDGLTCKL